MRPSDSGSRGPKTRAPANFHPGVEETAEITLTFDDNRLAGLVFGQYDQNLAHLERRLNVVANANGNRVTIRGSVEASEQARRVLEGLYERSHEGRALAPGDVDGAIEESVLQGTLFPTEEASVPSGRASAFEHIATRKRGPVRARNAAQNAYMKALKQYELVFAEGPAGTGKTWLAVGYAVSLLEQGQAERLVLSRPAVEAGERLGFLPGDMREKVDPYLRPIYDALYDFMEARHVERGLQTGMIEIAPLAFMRGRTLTNAVVLLDEAQNTTPMQMKMFLTRLGENSRMIVTGDPTQIDLPPGQKSGLIEAMRILHGVEGIGRVTFKEQDVVRHDLVRRIVTAYDAAAPGGTRRTAVIELDIVARGRRLVAPRRPAKAIARSAVEAALAVAPDAPRDVELSLLLTDDRAMRELNRDWRGKDKATNVLSFPAAVQPGVPGPRHLGDIALAYETLVREAQERMAKASPTTSRTSSCTAVLHLLGYDHELEAEAEIMEGLEVKALATLGIADPYGGMAA